MNDPVLELEPARAATLVAVDGRGYPLESAHLVARAEGALAMTTLAQTYANPHGEALEVIYTLPLPADGAVLGYTIRIGEKVIRAEVQPRDKAAADYRNALYEGRTAGLLEQTRPDTLQQKLGNVPPKTKVEVTIDVLHPLAFVHSGPIEVVRSSPLDNVNEAAIEWEYRFPTVAGVRYHGAPGRVPDVAELSPDRGTEGSIPARFDLTLSVRADSWPLLGPGFSSPSHAIECAAGDGGTVVRLRGGERLDRDVVVRWAAAGNAVGVRIVEGEGLEGDDGRYALITLVPPVAPRDTFPRDLTVLVDASGSMDGHPLELAKRVVATLLRSLDAGDRFELLAFSSNVKRLSPELGDASEESVARAIKALEMLRAEGATEMEHAIEKALEPVRAGAQRQVVLVTDGYIGFEADVVGRIANRDNVRLHAVGIGSAPNRSLTQQAAAAGRGLELLVGDQRMAAEAAARLVAGTARPVLTNLTVLGTALAVEPPARLRDVFARQPLVFAVELSPEGGTLELRGDLADGPWRTCLEVPATGGDKALSRTPLPIGALYGRAAIAEQELQLAGSPGFLATAIEERIEALGMRHRIASLRTSLVAIAEEPSVDPGKPRRRERLAVEMPAGVSAESAGIAGADSARFMLHSIVDSRIEPSHMLTRSRVVGRVPRLLREALASMLERRSADATPSEIELDAIAVHRLADELLAIEFETPSGGLDVPGGSVRLAGSDDAREAEPESCEIVAESSTRPGRARGGVVVRLVIRLAASLRTADGQRFELRWQAAGSGRDRKHAVPVRVRFAMPAHE